MQGEYHGDGDGSSCSGATLRLSLVMARESSGLGGASCKASLLSSRELSALGLALCSSRGCT